MRHRGGEVAGGGGFATLVLARTAEQHPALEARRLALEATLELGDGVFDRFRRARVGRGDIATGSVVPCGEDGVEQRQRLHKVEPIDGRASAWAPSG